MNIQDCPIEKGFPITLMLDAKGYNCCVGSDGENIAHLTSFELQAMANAVLSKGLILTLHGFRTNEKGSVARLEDGDVARFFRSFIVAPGVSKDNRLELTVVKEIWTDELTKEDFVY